MENEKTNKNIKIINYEKEEEERIKKIKKI